MQKDREGGAVLLGPNLVLTGQGRAVSSEDKTRRAGREFRALMACVVLIVQLAWIALR